MPNDCFTTPPSFSGKTNVNFFIYFLRKILSKNCSNDCILDELKDHINLFTKKTCSSLISEQTIFHFLSRYFDDELSKKIQNSAFVKMVATIDFNINDAMNKLVDIMYQEFKKSPKSQVIKDIIKNVKESKILSITRNFKEKVNGRNQDRSYTAKQDAEISKSKLNSTIAEESRYNKMIKIINIIEEYSQNGGKRKIYIGIKGGKYYIKNNKKIYIKLK